ncbi:hypothetical protein PF004_g20729 [Phytophthora fragariae]|uniref:Uncharacterized protein n=1 Tax=Phytophthora fragariae TaxID=53985 RepID=A0A6G0N586_9STRA|nr:hypothetical protein PF004_g20729 [Phytophthora fragariae]
MLLFCVYQPNVTSSSRRPSPASGGSGSSTAPPPPAASMGTTASSKLSTAQASSGGSGSSTTVTTTGREHGDDGIEQAEYGTGCEARTTARRGRSGSPTAAGSIESASQMKLVATSSHGAGNARGCFPRRRASPCCFLTRTTTLWPQGDTG